MALRRILFGPCTLESLPDPVNGVDVRWLVTEGYAEYLYNEKIWVAHSIELSKVMGDEFNRAIEFIERHDPWKEDYL